MEEFLLSIVIVSSFIVTPQGRDLFIVDAFKGKCPNECSQVICVGLTTLKKFCKGGIVYGLCGCCQVCAKLDGETCGGLGDWYGKCDHGMTCYPEHRPLHRRGTCRYITTKTPTLKVPSKKVNTGCRPACTSDYCLKNPDSICSAVRNALVSRGCQRQCQHTSCRACFFKTKRESPCPKCSHDDFDCMQNFSKCIRAETCYRQKHPCKPHKKREIDGRFVCKVPACTTAA